MLNKIRDFTLLDYASNLLLFFPISLFLGNAAPDIVLSSIAALFLAHTIKKRDFSWLKNTWVKIALLFWVYLCATNLWAVDPKLSISRSFTFVRFVLFACAVAYWIIPNKYDHKKMIKIMTFTVAFMSVNAIAQYFIGFDIIGNEAASDFRLTSIVGKMNVGIMLCMVFFPTAVYWLKNRNKFAIPYCLLALSAVLLSGERTALLSMILGLAITLLYIKELRIYILYGVIILAATVGVLSSLNNVVFNRQIVSTYNEIKNVENTTYGRIFKIAFELYQQKPVSGIGIKHFQKNCLSPEFVPSFISKEDWNSENSSKRRDYLCTLHPHNIYLEILSEAGVIAFALLISLLGSLLFGAWKRRKDFAKDPFKFGALINIGLKLIPIISTASFYSAWAIAPMWFMIGVIVNKTSVTKN